MPRASLSQVGERIWALADFAEEYLGIEMEGLRFKAFN
jgi:hypothetical protein